MAFNQPNYYQNPYMNYGQIQSYQPQQQYQQQYTQIQQPMLYGKVVDSIDVVKAHDLPISQTGIFPKGDLSEIYIKSWCSDGTTNVSEYKLVEQIDDDKSINLEEKLNNIYESIDALNKKIDKIKSSSTSTTRKKRVVEEVDEDD